MRIAQRVHQSLVKSPKDVDLDGEKIEFSWKPISQKTKVTTKDINAAKASWAGRLGPTLIRYNQPEKQADNGV